MNAVTFYLEAGACGVGQGRPSHRPNDSKDHQPCGEAPRFMTRAVTAIKSPQCYRNTRGRGRGESCLSGGSRLLA